MGTRTSRPAGSEVEVIGDTEDLNETIPIRYSITSYGADYPVDSLVDRLISQAIYVPTFQREFVWSIKQASRFVESLLLGLPVPGIFLSREQTTQKLIVIDGQQRLRTIQYFYAGLFEPSKRQFSLDLNSAGVNNLLNGLTYKTLQEDDRRHLDDSIIHATIIRQDEPSDGQSSVYSIFERLNTGGVQLAPQEIRASIFHGRFSELLRTLNENSSWRLVFGRPSARMRDQELILRFFALVFSEDTYSRPMNEYLNRYMDRNRELTLQSENQLTETFVPSVELIAEHIGSRAFKPKRAVNAAVFDAVMVGVAIRRSNGPIVKPWLLQQIHADLLLDADFLRATTRATADEQSVALRLDIATRKFAEVE